MATRDAACFTASSAGKTALTGMASANLPLRDFDAASRFDERLRIACI
ncbi:hypothetical protein [Burkholderia sola]|nr:hypothetical protein [Burkholderia sola]MDF3080091.1 hypothetical protein [Burkholderia sola]